MEVKKQSSLTSTFSTVPVALGECQKQTDLYLASGAVNCAATKWVIFTVWCQMLVWHQTSIVFSSIHVVVDLFCFVCFPCVYFVL